MLLEICVGSIQSAKNADLGGADRIELCDNLFEGGTTPSYGAIKYCVENLSLKTMVIIRPRGGDFLFDQDDLQMMIDDIKISRELGAHGVVIGALTADGQIDKDLCKRLMDHAGDMEVTFHRAFDMANNVEQALDDLIEIGCHRLLSSGQEASAFEGAETLKTMVDYVGDKMIIMPGAGITARNLDRIKNITGANEFHMGAHVTEDSKMTYQQGHVFMGGALRKPEFSKSVTSADKVANLSGIIKA